MRKPPTGEPCAGKPPARFGGRGGREPFPTPILGEVKGQGKYVVRSGTTFLQAISLAGGFTPFASKNKITLRRKGSEGKETVLLIRYKDVLAGQQANLILKPGDTIIVP